MKKKCIMFTVLSIKKQKIVSHGFMMVKYGLINIYGLKAEKQMLKKKWGVQCIQRLKNGINYNRMKGVKDSTKQDVKVQLYCAYIKGESNASDNVPGFWNDIRNKSN